MRCVVFELLLRRHRIIRHRSSSANAALGMKSVAAHGSPAMKRTRCHHHHHNRHHQYHLLLLLLWRRGDDDDKTWSRAERRRWSSSGNDVTVIPGDYRVGATLVPISVFLRPICHLVPAVFRTPTPRRVLIVPSVYEFVRGSARRI